jgi:hypothetical protein
MVFKKRKINFWKNILIIVFLAIFLSAAPVGAPKTQAFWGEIVESMLDYAMSMVKDVLIGMINNMLKQQASQMLIKMVDKLASGSSSGGSAFITNWQDYLVQQPRNQARSYMNDYLSQITVGRNSFTGYQAEGFFSAGTGSYFANLGEVAKNSFDPPLLVPTYEGNPSQMFDNGNFKNMQLYLSGVNNPWAMSILAQNEYETQLDENKSVNQAQSVAYQGFTGAGNDGTGKGNITYPGILAKENIADIQNIPNMALSTATHLGEVVAAVISTTITKSIQQGFGGAKRNAQRNIYDVQSRINSGMNNMINTSGPGARFDSGITTNSPAYQVRDPQN